MEVKRYRIEIRTPATLVYYLSEYDMEHAIESALSAPFQEWTVGDFDEPKYEDIIAEETRL